MRNCLAPNNSCFRSLPSRYTCVPTCGRGKGLARWQGGKLPKPRYGAAFLRPSRSSFTASSSKMKKKLKPESKTASTIFIGRWTAKILSSLKERPHRQGELRCRLGSVSQQILTGTLRNLESTGLIARSVTRSKSIAVEYSLTKLGRTVIAPLTSICRWENNTARN